MSTLTAFTLVSGSDDKLIPLALRLIEILLDKLLTIFKKESVGT